MPPFFSRLSCFFFLSLSFNNLISVSKFVSIIFFSAIEHSWVYAIVCQSISVFFICYSYTVSVSRQQNLKSFFPSRGVSGRLCLQNKRLSSEGFKEEKVNDNSSNVPKKKSARATNLYLQLVVCNFTVDRGANFSFIYLVHSKQCILRKTRTASGKEVKGVVEFLKITY